MVWISALSTIVAFVFAASVINRYRVNHGTHLLFWGIGLIFYGLGTLAEFSLSLTFSTLALKVWYLCGAMLTAAWLGQGSVFLLVRKPRIAKGLAISLVVLSSLAIVLVLLAPVTSAAAGYDTAVPASAQYDTILVRSGLITFLTIFLNIYGTITLVGGALYSAYLFWRKQVLLNRVIGNIMIAIGALFPALGGSLIKAGLVDLLYVSELVGVSIMYLGFLQAIKSKAPVPVKQTLSEPTSGD
jgi:hypothetical protein